MRRRGGVPDTVRRRARLGAFLGAAFLLASQAGWGQSPGVVAYVDVGTGPNGWGSPFGAVLGPGYTFSTPLAGVQVTGLSFFNTEGFGNGGGSALHACQSYWSGWSTRSCSFTVFLARVTALETGPRMGDGRAAVVASAVIDSTSSVRNVATGPPGAFWTTPLASPFVLTPGQLYLVFGGAVSQTVRQQQTGPAPPEVDPRITFGGFAGGYIHLADVGVADATLWFPDWSTGVPGVIGSTGASVVLDDVHDTAPEPATVLLLASGVAVIGAAWRLRRATH